MDDPHPLPAQAGGLWIPAWKARPGSYPALAEVPTGALELWECLHSFTGDFYQPCYSNRETLAKTIRSSERSITTYLAALRDADLMFELEEPRRMGERLPPLRWALDPLKHERWRPRVEKHIRRYAREKGRNERWLEKAIRELDAFTRRAAQMAKKLDDSLSERFRGSKRKRRRRANSASTKKQKLRARGVGLPVEGDVLPLRTLRGSEGVRERDLEPPRQFAADFTVELDGTTRLRA